MQIEITIPIVISIASLGLSVLKYFDKSKERIAHLETEIELLKQSSEYHEKQVEKLSDKLDEVKDLL